MTAYAAAMHEWCNQVQHARDRKHGAACSATKYLLEGDLDMANRLAALFQKACADLDQTLQSEPKPDMDPKP